MFGEQAVEGYVRELEAAAADEDDNESLPSLENTQPRRKGIKLP